MSFNNLVKLARRLTVKYSLGEGASYPQEAVIFTKWLYQLALIKNDLGKIKSFNFPKGEPIKSEEAYRNNNRLSSVLTFLIRLNPGVSRNVIMDSISNKSFSMSEYMDIKNSFLSDSASQDLIKALEQAVEVCIYINKTNPSPYSEAIVNSIYNVIREMYSLK